MHLNPDYFKYVELIPKLLKKNVVTTWKGNAAVCLLSLNGKFTQS